MQLIMQVYIPIYIDKSGYNEETASVHENGKIVE